MSSKENDLIVKAISDIEELLNYTKNNLVKINALLDNIEEISNRARWEPRRNLYWVASRSGRPEGHFIEIFEKNRVQCSCIGFTNRSYCWASEWVQKNYGARATVAYPSTEGHFDSRIYPIGMTAAKARIPQKL